MKMANTISQSIIFTIIFLLSISLGFSQNIFENNITGENPNTYDPYTIGQGTDANLTVSGIGRGADVEGKNRNNQYCAKGWDSDAFNENDYFEFTLVPNSGYKLNFVSFQYSPKRNNNGSVDSFEFRSSIDNYSFIIAEPGYDAQGVTIDLSAAEFQDVNEAITFRLYAWGANTYSKFFSVKDFVFNGTCSIDETLSIVNQNLRNGDLKIIEYQNGEVQFKLPDNFIMKSIQIIDLQGRNILNLKVNGNSKVLNLFNLNRSTIYVARVQLTNGDIITKKAVKRY